MKKQPLHSIRKDYRLGQLRESTIHPNPFQQFSLWLQQALDKVGHDSTAMALATADSKGSPSVRIVLLKEFTERGFVFFTNYESRKGMDLAMNPQVALLFFWSSLERQVRVEGEAYKISEEESDAYFLSRPLESRLAAHISPQSRVIPDREFLEFRLSEMKLRAAAHPVMRPDHWGGYLVVPKRIEFWQGGASRLHDRLCYVLRGDHWKIERLAP